MRGLTHARTPIWVVLVYSVFPLFGLNLRARFGAEPQNRVSCVASFFFIVLWDHAAAVRERPAGLPVCGRRVGSRVGSGVGGDQRQTRGRLYVCVYYCMQIPEREQTGGES